MEINEFVLKCLNADKGDRFASADDMLTAWDDTIEKAEHTEMEKAEHTEASRFWTENLPNSGSEGDVGVEVTKFVKLFCEKFSISDAAGRKLAFAADEDGDGMLTREEFLKTFSKYGMKELAQKYETEADKEAASPPAGEPANSYHGPGKRLVFTDVRYKSKGLVMGGSKERIGTLTLEHGAIEARRFEGGQSIPVYNFCVESSMLVNCNPSSNVTTTSGIIDVSIKRGENGGCGIGFIRNPGTSQSGSYVIQELVKTGAAAKSGQLAVGDQIHCVDYVGVQDKNVEEVRKLLIGEGTLGSIVVIGVQKAKGETARVKAVGEQVQKMPPASLEIASTKDKSTAFTFKSPADCKQFAEAFHATQTWMSG